jgi:hypothetical protein
MTHDLTAREAKLAELWTRYHKGAVQAEMNELRERIRTLTAEIEHERDRRSIKLPLGGYEQE